MPEEELGSEMPPGVGLAGLVLLARAPVVLERYAMVPHPMPTELPENAVVGLPLFWRERPPQHPDLREVLPRTRTMTPERHDLFS